MKLVTFDGSTKTHIKSESDPHGTLCGLSLKGGNWSLLTGQGWELSCSVCGFRKIAAATMSKLGPAGTAASAGDGLVFAHKGEGIIPASNPLSEAHARMMRDGIARAFNVPGVVVGTGDIEPSERPCPSCGPMRGTMLRTDERACWRCGWVRA